MMCTPSRERDFAGLQLSAVRRRSALLDAAADFRTVADFRKDHLAALDHNRKKDAIAKEVARILAEAERVDAGEDQKYGPDRRGDELPEELRSNEGRLKG
ncbi:MAG: hypothetical protein IID61_12640 [SAR324 cluster bacterium]|nr:hypothetical protein [SAR324 cluster bacterium]